MHAAYLRRAIVLIPGLCIALACGDECTQPSSHGGAPPVYVTVYSHNEDTWEPWVGSRGRYVAYRENLVERVGIIREFGAALDWQSDLVVLKAMIREEDDSLRALTGGRNILEYMRDQGVSVDPHGHLFQCNYADLAHWIEQLGVTPSGVIGGLPCQDCGTSYLGFLDRKDWRAEIELGADGLIRGRVVPEASWRPQILSVPGMPGHWFDELSSGVWKPGDGEAFQTHRPESGIVYVGQGYPHDITNLGPTQASGAEIYAQQGAYIKELVGKLKSGEIRQEGMVTASIHIRDCETVEDNAAQVNVNAGLREILGILRPLAEDGDVVYVTYPEAVRIWREVHGERPTRIDFSGFSMYEAVKAQAMEHCGVDPAGSPLGQD